jgi:hypothetical protein
VVDRQHRTLTVLGNDGAGWDVVVELDEHHPTGAVTVGTHGTVPLDLGSLLAP